MKIFNKYLKQMQFQISKNISSAEGVRIMVDLVAENLLPRQLKVLVIDYNNDKNNISKLISLMKELIKSCEYLPTVKLDIALYSEFELQEETKVALESYPINFLKDLQSNLISSVNLLVLSSMENNAQDNKLKDTIRELNESAYILINNFSTSKCLQFNGFLSISKIERFQLELFKKVIIKNLLIS